MGNVRCSHSGELDEKVYGNFLLSLQIKKKSFFRRKQAGYIAFKSRIVRKTDQAFLHPSPRHLSPGAQLTAQTYRRPYHIHHVWRCGHLKVQVI